MSREEKSRRKTVGKRKTSGKKEKKPKSNISTKKVTNGNTDNSSNKKDEKEGVETPEPLEVPQEWKDKGVEALVEQGFQSYVKPVGNYQYIVLRKGRKNKSLGRFSVGNWNLLHKLFPKLVSVHNGNFSEDGFPKEETFPNDIIDVPIGRRSKRKPQFTGIKMERPVIFPSKYVPTLKIMRFYEIYRSNGGNTEFNEFINDIVETHLRKCHGFMIDKLPYLVV